MANTERYFYLWVIAFVVVIVFGGLSIYTLISRGDVAYSKFISDLEDMDVEVVELTEFISSYGITINIKESTNYISLISLWNIDTIYLTTKTKFLGLEKFFWFTYDQVIFHFKAV